MCSKMIGMCARDLRSSSWLLPSLALAVALAACDDKAADPPPADEPKREAGQRMDEAKKEIDAAQKALEERGDHIADQSNAQ